LEAVRDRREFSAKKLSIAEWDFSRSTYFGRQGETAEERTTHGGPGSRDKARGGEGTRAAAAGDWSQEPQFRKNDDDKGPIRDRGARRIAADSTPETGTGAQGGSRRPPRLKPEPRLKKEPDDDEERKRNCSSGEKPGRPWRC
jgi:hypothetical protein